MKLSVFMPTIRTHLLNNWYISLEKSCNRHDFEVVLCGPFDPPQELINKKNVKFIKDYGSPTRSAQIAAINCEGNYIYHVVDDIIFYENLISDELDYMDENTIISMRYKEGQSHSGNELPLSYWTAGSSYTVSNINPSWLNCVHFIMPNLLFRKYGGFDCQYEYLNHATHDLLFRIQSSSNNINCRLSFNTISSADWMPGTTGDHAPIHYAQTEHDSVLFDSNWKKTKPNPEISLYNYQNQEDIWKRRFTGKETKYEELK